MVWSTGQQCGPTAEVALPQAEEVEPVNGTKGRRPLLHIGGAEHSSPEVFR